MKSIQFAKLIIEGRVYVDELQELFYDTFENGFHMVAEDGSVEEVYFPAVLKSLGFQITRKSI